MANKRFIAKRLLKMEIFMMVFGRMVCKMVKVHVNLLVEIFITVIGKMANKRVKVK